MGGGTQPVHQQGRPGGSRPIDNQIDWQTMVRVSPQYGHSAVPDPNAPRTDVSQRYSERTAAAVNAKALPRRMKLGTQSSPTTAWYPDLDNVGKLGGIRSNGKPA